MVVGWMIAFFWPSAALVAVSATGAVLLLVGAVVFMLITGGQGTSYSRADYWARLITLAGAFTVGLGALAALDQKVLSFLAMAGALSLVVVLSWVIRKLGKHLDKKLDENDERKASGQTAGE
ncbi:hypothetical protein [Microbacterium neimengense]